MFIFGGHVRTMWGLRTMSIPCWNFVWPSFQDQLEFVFLRPCMDHFWPGLTNSNLSQWFLFFGTIAWSCLDHFWNSSRPISMENLSLGTLPGPWLQIWKKLLEGAFLKHQIYSKITRILNPKFLLSNEWISVFKALLRVKEVQGRDKKIRF